jgi:hypothetical protein
MMASQLMMRSALRLLIFTRPVSPSTSFEQDLDAVADLDAVRVVELAALQDAFGLEAQLDDEVVAGVAARLCP